LGLGGEVTDGAEPVGDLERRLLPSLRAAEAEINAAFPGVQARVWSLPVGQATDSPGHVIALSCFFPEAPPNQSDEVTLQVCIGSVRGPGPSLDAAVIWGYPGQLEADLFPGPVAMSEDALRQLEAELPRLLEVLRTAVTRGRPLT
jgi:hypothetical protein